MKWKARNDSILVLVNIFVPVLTVEKFSFKFQFNLININSYHPGTFSGASHFLMSSLKTSPAPHDNSRGSIPLRQT